jgi:hypothetical protein
MWARRLAIGVVFFAGLVLAALLVGELAVRFAYRDITTTSTAEGYFSRRWKQEHVQRNEWGFRERDIRFQERDDLYRIAVVGDSVTFGPGIRVEERFSDLMMADLNAQGEAFDVLQFGLPGAELDWHVDTLLRFVRAAKPQFVLLQWSINDVLIPREGVPKLQALLGNVESTRALRRRSALYDLANRRWRAIQLRGGWMQEYEHFMRDRYGDPGGFGWRTVMRHFDRFVTACEEAGIEKGVVLFPALTRTLADDYRFGYLHEQMLAECRAREIPCLDLRETFEPHAAEIDAMWVNDFDHHPGPRAHRLAADRILEFFEFEARAGSG